MVCGTVMLIPGLWAIAIFMGLEVPRHDWPNVKSMAALMLICLPLALAMYGGAIYFHRKAGPPPRTRR
jgi:hypothetical protein